MLERSLTYKPFKYPFAVQYAELHEKMHWIEQEVDLADDVIQWNNGVLTYSEKNLICEIMKTFTQSDVEVSKGYLEYFIPTFKNNEIRMMLMSFAAREGIHIRAYSLFTDTIGLPDETYRVFLEYEELKEKLESMTKMDMSNPKEIAKSIARTVVSEGICLFGAFVMLLNFQRFGKMLGLSKITEWSLKDEDVHVEGMIKLFRIFLDEHKEIVDNDLKQGIYQMFRDAVELEDKFIDLAFAMGDVEGLTRAEVKTYIRYMADRRLIQLGLKSNYGVKDNNLKWLDWILSADSVSNFFEQKVTEYSSVGMTGEWGW